MENTIIHGDCLEVMKQLPDKSIDLILTDPPYGTTACEWDKVPDLKLMWRQLDRVCKPNAAKVMTASQPFTTDLINSNRKQFRYEWIWKKTVGGGFLNCNKAPLKRHENIVIFSKETNIYNPQKHKGKKYTATRTSGGKTLGRETSNKVAGWKTENDGSRYPITVLEVPNITGDHPTQKPVELMKYLIRTYSNKGDIVLDPFCGSGTTCVAAKQLGRKYIGIELDEGYYHIADMRVSEAVEQLSLLD